MRVFIAGCARSGTTLFRALMRDIRDVAVIGDEKHFTALEEMETNARVLVAKRVFKSWKTLHEIPDHIRLIYCIRHPYDVLTSEHERTPPGQRFYVTPERWSNEYGALEALRGAQPARDIFFARYEDVVLKTEEVGDRLCSFLGVELTAPFGTVRPPFSSSLYKWKADPARAAYIENLPGDFRRSLEGFAGEFGYEL